MCACAPVPVCRLYVSIFVSLCMFIASFCCFCSPSLVCFCPTLAYLSKHHSCTGDVVSERTRITTGMATYPPSQQASRSGDSLLQVSSTVVPVSKHTHCQSGLRACVFFIQDSSGDYAYTYFDVDPAAESLSHLTGFRSVLAFVCHCKCVC